MATVGEETCHVSEGTGCYWLLRNVYWVLEGQSVKSKSKLITHDDGKLWKCIKLLCETEVSVQL